MAIVLRATKGSALTHEEMDNNFQELETKVNAKTTGLVSKTQTLVAGNNTVTHGSGKKARIVTFFLADGTPTNYEWKRDPANQNNAIIVVVPADTPARELAATEINILCI